MTDDATQRPRPEAPDGEVTNGGEAAEDTEAILSRRAFLISTGLATAGVAAGCGEKRPRPCLTVTRQPQPCLSKPPPERDAAAPRPCLEVNRKPDAGAPRPCLTVKPPPQPCLTPKPCLKVKPQPQPCLSKPPPSRKP